jgi:hypothetical protein
MEAKILLLEIRFRYLARNFVTRMLTNEDHPLRTTQEIIVWQENKVNIDTVGTVPLIEAFVDTVPKEQLIGKASLPLCSKTKFTSVMSRPSVGIDTGMKLVASSKLTPNLFGIFFEKLKQTRTVFTDGSKSADRPFGDFSIFDYHKGKSWGYRTSQIASIFISEALSMSESLIRVNEVKGRNFNIFSDFRCATTAIS